jgi:hypothetical protein
MSASSKKKLRNAEAAEKMTERQLAEKKEAKKLKIYTVVFTVVVVAMLIFAVTFGAYKGVTNSGILQRNTVAATVNGKDLTSTELNYYYIDYINNFCSQYSGYLPYIIDTTKALDEQQYSDTMTWADYFLSEALRSAASNHALADAANAAGHTLTDEEKVSIDATLQNATFSAMYSYGFPDLESYLKGMYGNGATEESFREYMTISALANSYYNTYSASLTYTDDEIRAADEANPLAYNGYTYNYYYIPVADFLPEGVTEADATEEQLATARDMAEHKAKTLTAEEITDVAAFDAAVALIKENATSFACDNYLYSSLLSVAQEWISDASRQEGDKNYFAYTSHTHAEGETHAEDEDTSAYDVVKGYYAVFFTSSTDNTTQLVNVRHVLITEGGTYNSSTGSYTYTDDMAAAKAKAEELLAQWQAGEATEETFIELAKQNSSDGNAQDGGLYEKVYPGQMVPTYNDWCFDASRKAGDTGIVKTDFGYHIMYFVGQADINYRDYMITNELTSTDLETWYADITGNVATQLLNTKYIKTDLVLSSAQ